MPRRVSLLLTIWFLCCLLLPQHATAQYAKSALTLQVDSILADLHQQQIDTICVYEAYCVGCRGYYIAHDSPCRTKGILIPTYIFWQQAGHTYTRYLDNCTIGPIKKLPNPNFWSYFFTHSEQIKREKIKEFATFSHGSVFSFSFYIKADTTEQYFEGVNLEKALKHPKMKNQYYRHNSHTHTAHLQVLLSEAASIFPAP